MPQCLCSVLISGPTRKPLSGSELPVPQNKRVVVIWDVLSGQHQHTVDLAGVGEAREQEMWQSQASISISRYSLIPTCEISSWFLKSHIYDL